MTRMHLLVLPLVSTTLASCVGFSIGTDDDEFFRYRGLGTAYVAAPGFDDYDGKILKVGLFTRSPGGGQIAGVELWPLLSVGVGVAGARIKVLPFEVGAGILFYHPTPQRRDLSQDSGDDDRPTGRARRLRLRTEAGGDELPVRWLEGAPEESPEAAPPAPAAEDAARPDVPPPPAAIGPAGRRG